MNVHDYLDERHIHYDSIPHRPTFDAQRLAQAVAESGHHVAKAVLLKSEGEDLLAVVPATHAVDLNAAAAAIGARCVSLATEEEVTSHFPDCEMGAVPPFGSLYGIKTLVDQALTECEEIVCEGNRADEALRLRTRDYLELEQPMVIHLSHERT